MHSEDNNNKAKHSTESDHHDYMNITQGGIVY